MFEVSLNFDYFIFDGTAGNQINNNPKDQVSVDFADNNSGYEVLCPSVQLEILTRQ